MRDRHQEQKIWMVVIPAIWFLYWLVGIIAKFIPRSLDVGFFISSLAYPSELDTYKANFELIGISNDAFPIIFLTFVVVLESIAALLMLGTVLIGFSENKELSRNIFYAAILMGVGIFMLLILTNQVFNSRERIVESAVFLLLILFSWYLYDKLGDFNNKKT